MLARLAAARPAGALLRMSTRALSASSSSSILTHFAGAGKDATAPSSVVLAARRVRVAHKDAAVKLLASEAYRRREDKLLSDFMWCVTECELAHAAKVSKIIEDPDDPDDATPDVAHAMLQLASGDAAFARVLRDVGTGKASLAAVFDYFEVPLGDEAKDAFDAAMAYRLRTLSWLSGRSLAEQRRRFNADEIASPPMTRDALLRTLERAGKYDDTPAKVAALASAATIDKDGAVDGEEQAAAPSAAAEGESAPVSESAAESAAETSVAQVTEQATELELSEEDKEDAAELKLYEELEASPENQYRFYRKELPYYASDELVLQAPAGTKEPRRRHGDEHQWLALGEELEETLPYDYWEDADRNIRDDVRFLKWLSSLPEEELEDVMLELDPELENEEFTDPGLAVADAEQTFMHALHVTFPKFFTVERLSAYFGVSMARASAILRLKQHEYGMRARGEPIDAYFGEQMETASGLHDMWMEDQDHRMVRYARLYTLLRRHTLREALREMGIDRAPLPPVADEIQHVVDELTRRPDGVDIVAPSFDDLPDALKAMAGSREAYVTEQERRELSFVDDPQGLEEDWSFLRSDEEEREFNELVGASTALKVAAGVDEPRQGILPRLVLVDEDTKVVPRTQRRKRTEYAGLVDAHATPEPAPAALVLEKNPSLGNSRAAFRFVDKSRPLGQRTVVVREKDGTLRKGTQREFVKVNRR